MSTISLSGINASEPLRPDPATVIEIITETPNIRTLRLVFDDDRIRRDFSFLPGQIGQLGILGAGESTFAISSPPSETDYIQFSVMKTGEVTRAIHELAVGDKVALRAPMGCAFPTGDWEGKNILLIAGGIGMAPLRSLFLDLIDYRARYADLTLIYGARTPGDLCFADDCRAWEASADVGFTATIDCEHPQWGGCVGLVPNVIEAQEPLPENTVAVICGPPIMIRYAFQSLEKMGFREEQIYTTLERRMKCGIGICGRCNVGAKYVCTDGPVFSLAQLGELPDEL